MESPTPFFALVASIFIYLVYRIANWLWFKPKNIEKFLRKQGLNGTSYKFMFGDLKEIVQMSNEAKSKPMSLNHDIANRVLAFYYSALSTHGMSLQLS